MKTKLHNSLLTFGLALVALCCSEQASADVFVNRIRLPPTPEERCPFTTATFRVTSTVTWDGGYQNDWGNCVGLPPGPPFIFEFPISVEAGGTLNISGVPIALTQHMDTFPGSTLNLMGADVGFLGQPISVQGTITATYSSFSGSGLAFTPLSLYASPSALFDHCTFTFSDSTASNAILQAENSTSGTLTIDHSLFSYAGSTAVLVSLDHRAGPLHVTNSSFAGANGQALNIFNGSDVTFENNTFTDTDCGSPPRGLNCGAPVSFRASLIRSIQGNLGTSNKINGIVLHISGNGPTQPSGTWSTTGELPLVVTGGSLTINPGQTLNVEAGTVFKSDAGLGIIVTGSLNVLGDPTSPVYLTSLNDNSVGGTTIAGRPAPAPGDWLGVDVYRLTPTTRASANFSNCSVRFAGASNGVPAIRHFVATTSISNCSITLNKGPGVYGEVHPGDSIDVLGSEIRDNGGMGVSLIGYLSTSTVQNNAITGNAQGVNVGTFSDATGDLSVLGNLISGNTGVGIMIANAASPFVVDNIISANGQDGIVKQGQFFTSLKLLNNSVFGNGGHGIQLQSTAAGIPIANNLIWENVGFAIAETMSTFGRSVPRFNDLFGNGGGLYRRADGMLLTLDEINALPGADGNISEDPLLRAVLAGTSTDLVFDAVSGTSTLTDTNAFLAPDALVGLSINPNLAQDQQFLVIANTGDTITVLGNMTTVAAVGDAYLIAHPLLYDPASPLIDAGDVLTHPILPPTEFGGRFWFFIGGMPNDRVIDGGTGRGPIVDIGAHEFDPGE